MVSNLSPEKQYEILLKMFNEHQNTNSIELDFSELKTFVNANEKEKLIEKIQTLKSDFSTHFALEEGIVFPTLKIIGGTPEVRSLIDILIREHSQIKDSLNKMLKFLDNSSDEPLNTTQLIADVLFTETMFIQHYITEIEKIYSPLRHSIDFRKAIIEKALLNNVIKKTQ